MQEIDRKYVIKEEFSLEDCLFSLLPWDRVFFYGDLGAGKSTFIRHLLRKYYDESSLVVRSPTYTYYEKYMRDNFPIVYHCDLYRVDNYDGFVSIGGEEILDDNSNILLIEWPELLEWRVKPTKIVKIKLNKDGMREIVIS